MSPKLNHHSDPSVSLRPGAALPPRWALRAATADAHARLDTLYSRLDLSRCGDYRRFLASHAAAFLPVEAGLARAGADDLVPGWSERRRGAALRADLAALGVTLPPTHAAPAFNDEGALLGGLYVLEGSRLGGAVLIRAVAAGAPTAFLRPETPPSWRAFTALLDLKLTSDASIDRAAAAANAVFAVFERCARAVLEPTNLAE